MRDYLSPDVESLEMESQEILCVSSNFIEDMTFGEKSDGAWRIIKLSHSLSANDPKAGDWESTMTCFYPHLSGAIGRFI